MKCLTQVTIVLPIFTLLLLFFIRSTHGAFPFYEIRPPKGKILIFADESKQKIIWEIDQQPALHSVSDTPSDVEGYIATAYPADACTDIVLPPSIPGKSTKTHKWILLAEQEGCRYQEKVTNGFLANYAAIVIHNDDSNQTEVIGDDGDVVLFIPAFFIGKADANLLRQNFTFPNLFYVQIQRAEIFWGKMKAYCIWVAWALVSGVLVFVLLYFVIRAIISNCSHLFSSSRNCGVCRQRMPAQEGYDLMARMSILPCSHEFHSFCLMSYATMDGMICPTCDNLFEFHRHEESSEGPSSSKPSKVRNASKALSISGFRKQKRDRRPLILSPPEFIQKTN